ncbi:hypothetical protein PsYK624_106670 [Phanerochaete sordida]|uniref:Uncharacterized protein n=1 Tax=Phanerochaete sordida TaxID=48140 RepID=A0A9P3LHU1_9APHY|nr:hypothetical protein PsYK624_106670 [Phanerochaete sordida]
MTFAPTTTRTSMPSMVGSITLQNDTTITPPDSPLSPVNLSLPSLAESHDYQYNPHYLLCPRHKERAQHMPTLYLPPLLSLSLDELCIPEPTSSFRPYTTYQPDLAAATLALHRALHHFRPITEQHADMPFDEAFNWDELSLPEDTEREWFAVVTHSKAKSGTTDGPLYEVNKHAHEEALRHGGLILYWDSAPHPVTGVKMTTCIWRSRAHAIAAHSGPHHIRALRRAVATHERYDMHRYRLRKIRGESTLRVERYDDGDEGW